MNYAEKLHVHDLAVMAGFSESHFQHRFAALLGITTHRYFRRIVGVSPGLYQRRFNARRKRA